MNKKRIGEKLKKLRGEQNLVTVARAVGISPSAISMYENGERIPRDNVKVKLAKYYGVSVASIFFAD